MSWGSGYSKQQIAFNHMDGKMFYRICIQNLWNSWKEVSFTPQNNTFDWLGSSETLEGSVLLDESIWGKYTNLICTVNVKSNGTVYFYGNQIILPVAILKMATSTDTLQLSTGAASNEGNFVDLYITAKKTGITYWYSRYINTTGLTNVSFLFQVWGQK